MVSAAKPAGPAGPGKRRVRRGFVPRAGPARPGAVDGPAGRPFPPRPARFAQAGGCVAIGLLCLLIPLQEAADRAVVLAACGCGGALVLVHLAAFGRRRTRFRGTALALEAVLGLAPVPEFGAAWAVFSCFFLGSLPLVARLRVAVPVLVLVTAGAGALAVRAAGPAAVADGLRAALLTAVTAFAVFGLAWLAGAAALDEDGRREVAAQVVAEERRRFSRDTHDLLGLSLSAITLRVELIRRLVDDSPQAAQAELAELLTISRKALADVRAIAAGSREMSLAEECRSAASVLRAAGITVGFDGQLPGDLPSPVATTLAAVLRESVTNVIRHSKAVWCDFSVVAAAGAVRLQVANDGVPSAGEDPPAGENRGSGLRNLTYRVEALGGELSVGVRPDGTHRLCAVVPLRAPA
ncbi:MULTISPECIES: histidine kinase [unclassified Amycolatopsis]|uniref:sensor histidine kinase n=1 Tax=unclassified Amycolatopsis TaxID=2618356 RepID=UPI002876F07D|nr:MULTISPECIES: histidine kinase [unclassified Amycolatopsis]MDS0136186.1 sensor histidine kinase [Amycolatopsis sp. 505]MDS0145701.1 sensor histidine kinase [Amycolatopsis sp. CM201R]